MIEIEFGKLSVKELCGVSEFRFGEFIVVFGFVDLIEFRNFVFTATTRKGRHSVWHVCFHLRHGSTAYDRLPSTFTPLGGVGMPGGHLTVQRAHLCGGVGKCHESKDHCTFG